ncbi:MAG: type VI secretion system tip protein VgrG [Sterolibacteriaceae bacterium]|nr:type VI secretion system tip protein VgrG [Sterolibacteriaceae bacterium]MBK9086517.1 type VI secretion system tip protein VgrG [Sterolibacteriaceae bacterium]
MGLLCAVPRDRPQLHRPADGTGRHLHLLPPQRRQTHPRTRRLPSRPRPLPRLCQHRLRRRQPQQHHRERTHHRLGLRGRSPVGQIRHQRVRLHQAQHPQQQNTLHPREHEQSEHEIYDYPGEYDSLGEGDGYVRLRLEALQARHERIQALANVRGLSSGYTFTLKGHPRADQNKQYLVIATHLELASNEHEAAVSSGATFTVSFEAIPAATQYRSERQTPKPLIHGLQTAKVVGPPGEEIYTDEYGRVKVHFYWDRHGKEDENASCWIRVSQPWAGKNFGMKAVPRIGQEMVVEFLEGDPDRPLITGRVYNAEQMPPWELPANKTQTGILSRSSMGGAYSNANALRFEDKKGEEQLWLHAEKDQLTEVENDEDKWVGNDRRKTIDGHETSVIHKNRTETVDLNETITVHGKRTETVDGDETITIHQNRKERVDQSEKISIGANRTEDVGANETVSIGSNRSHKIGSNHRISVGANKIETVKLTYTETTGIAKIETIGAAYMLNIGATWMSNVGFMHSHNVGMTYKISVGKTYSNEVGAASHKMDSEGNIVLQGAGTMINMDKDVVITIKAKKIKIEAEQIVDVDGKVIDLN